MPRTLKIAALQMDVASALTAERLARAGRLAAQAAQAGAQLAVLPELFNTGYAYTDENFRRAERHDGPTVQWMRETAARLNVHLAGTLLLVDGADIFNALLLFAPDGRMWRYDKNYPWGWERGYFREGRGITIAHTDLGDFGLMICWDGAHRDLWRQYAGLVDLMLICSCPPDLGSPTYLFPNGAKVTAADMGPAMARMKNAARQVFGEMFNQQTAWLGVPLVNTVASGQFLSAVPNGRGALLAFLPTAPWLANYLPLASQMQVICSMTSATKIVDAQGQTLAEVTQAQAESFALAEVTLADQKAHPTQAQPRSLASPFAYLVADNILPWLSLSTYNRGIRQAWGSHMAPASLEIRRWLPVAGGSLAVSLLAGVLIGFWLGRRKS
jgi:predicted amidohydrolase